MKNKHELQTADFGLMGFYTYKGVIVQKLIGGYMVLGEKVVTEKEVDLVIKKAVNSIFQSAITIKSGFSCQNAGNVPNLADN